MAGQRWDMSQGAFDQAAKGTAGRTQDLGGLVKQLVDAAAPLEGKFSGEGKKQFDAFKQNVDGVAADLNAGMAHLAVGQSEVGSAMNTAQDEQVSAAKQNMGAAEGQSAAARRFSGR
jgi:uncharacterized protein YukE